MIIFLSQKLTISRRLSVNKTHAMKRLILLLCSVSLTSCVHIEGLDVPNDSYADQPWTWECIDSTCTKQLNECGSESSCEGSKKPPTSFEVCRLTCPPGVLWPKPTGTAVISDTLVPINLNTIFVKSKFPDENSSANSEVRGLVKKAGKRFVDIISSKVKGTVRVLGKNPTITLDIHDPSVTIFQQNADESYQLDVSPSSGEVNVKIAAETFLGARHGLETLSQLTVFDSVSGVLVMPSEIRIVDKPKYTHRGILLDTARNFVSLEVIKKTIEGMAMNKLNTFHWHITDSHSFPFESKSHPQLTKLGAYSPNKIYTEDDIASLVEFSKVRGVRVLPEFDAPAHVGEGWQWAGDATVCVNKQPWRSYCVEPPCGQLNPTSEKMYSILEGIYHDMEKLFESDIFHMGGDEVNINCWNTTDIVVENMKKKGMGRSDEDFHKLWADFQSRAASIHEKVAGKSKKIVLWTSTLTEKGKVDKYLDNKKYIIQIWTLGNDPVIAELVIKGFPVIFSNYDALYFDCGFGAWVGTGNNWCSPYIPWQKVYENDPVQLLSRLGVNETLSNLVLGSEATLWTEQADDQSIGNRLWPRAAAMAEQLWSNGGKWNEAEHRFLLHRQRMADSGINPDTVEPEWCLQNPGNCY